MSADADERLPYTPTHTLRGSGVGFLGIEGANFNELWPLLAGAAGSTALVIAFAAGGIKPEWSWTVRAATSASPVAVGYSYLRLLVQGRPPHYKEDLWRTLRNLRGSWALSHASTGWLPRVSVQCPRSDPLRSAAQAFGADRRPVRR